MVTLKNRLLVEFDESIVTRHILPVIAEWLSEKRERKPNKDFARRTSHDVMIDKLLKETE